MALEFIDDYQSPSISARILAGNEYKPEEGILEIWAQRLGDKWPGVSFCVQKEVWKHIHIPRTTTFKISICYIDKDIEIITFPRWVDLAVFVDWLLKGGPSCSEQQE